MTMDLLLVRHGQTDWNPKQKIMGPHPVPLNETGIKQVRQLKEWLRKIPIDAIYSSPMVRAMETASILVEGRESLMVFPEAGVGEINYGDWIEMTFEEVEQKYNQEYNAYRFQPAKMKIPGGEWVHEAQARAVAAIEKIRAKHEGQKVLVVSHADVIKSIIIHYLNIPLDRLQIVGCDNASLSVFRFGTAWGDRLVALNHFADVQKILPW